jgi:hypothetical protein
MLTRPAEGTSPQIKTVVYPVAAEAMPNSDEGLLEEAA